MVVAADIRTIEKEIARLQVELVKAGQQNNHNEIVMIRRKITILRAELQEAKARQEIP